MPAIARWWWLLPLTIGLAARVTLAAALPIMFDEAWTIKQSVDVSSDMFLGREGDASPPLSYLVFAGWAVVSRRIGWFRGLAIALSLASIYPGILLARRLFGGPAVEPTAWILAVWPLPLYAGWNVRYYCLCSMRCFLPCPGATGRHTGARPTITGDGTRAAPWL